MTAPTHVVVLHRVARRFKSRWRLELHWCRYNHPDGYVEHGYRFMWVTPEGRKQAARGQARIPSREISDELWKRADAAGWGHLDASPIDGTDDSEPDEDEIPSAA